MSESSESLPVSLFEPVVIPERPDLEIDAALNIRPELEKLGIIEVERGVCQDTHQNRAILRSASMGWDPVYATNGVPTGLIQARSKEMLAAYRTISLTEKKPILVDPTFLNSDYLTGLDLLAEEKSDYLVPSWVLGATRKWQSEQTTPLPPTSKKKPATLPTRCRHIKEDRIRCMLWSSGRLSDDRLCRVHLGSQLSKPGEDVERARARLVQAAPYAVDMLEELMLNASSEPVKLKASTEILDRAGVRGGVEFDARIVVTDEKAPAQVIAERLNRLAAGAVAAAARMAAAGVTVPNDADIVDAEIVEEESE